MLPDQLDNLFNLQFFITLILWLGILIAWLRRPKSIAVRSLAVLVWLAATVILCPFGEKTLKQYYNTLIYEGIQDALDEKCGQGYAQAEAGLYAASSSYHWHWNGQHSGGFVICDYERGDTAWNCVC
jgi:hypothetical protein